MLLPLFTQAQDTLLQDLPASWSLENSIAYARKHNISVNTQKLSAGSAQEDLLQARAAKLPNLTGSLSGSLVNSTNTDPVVGGFQTQASFSNSYSLNSSIILYNGGYIKNDVKAKELSVKAASLDVQGTENDITLSITQAFLNILLARENIVYLEEVLTTSRAQIEQAQQRFNAGGISRKDLLQFEAQVASDEYNLVNARNTYKQNTLTLKQILLLPSSYDFEVSAPADIAQQYITQSLAEGQAAARATRPEVQNAELAVQLAGVELEKVKASTKPTVSLGATLSSGYSNNQVNPYLQQLNNNFYQSLGLSVSVPIYSRRANKTNINKYKIQVEQAKLSQLDTKSILDQQVEQSYNNWQNSVAQYKAAEVQRRASEEAYRITNKQLELGAVNMVELLQQKNTYVQAAQQYIQARYSSILYNRIFNFYAGIPITL